MARDINRPILHAEAVEHFINNILPVIQREYEQDGIPDIPARSEAWCNWTDSLCKDGQISDWQYENWDHPPCNE
jgi:hypothetical protein